MVLIQAEIWFLSILRYVFNPNQDLIKTKIWFNPRYAFISKPRYGFNPNQDKV